MNTLKRHISQRALAALLALSIAIVAFLSYKDILGYFFTASDALPLIETSRIQSPGDLARIFSEPLMGGTFFAENWKYYRPIANLSYSLDYAVWRLNPFGYHLTDLLLHILVSLLVFFFARSLAGGRLAAAWLSAIVFATHPILVENVPAVARRHDMIAGAFMLCSLLLFSRYVSRVESRKLYLSLSLVCCVLALGAKEISVVLPFLVFCYSMIPVRAGQEAFILRVKQAVKDALPYLAVTAAVLMWRTYVLQGLGGYLHSPENINAPGLVATLSDYVLDLFYPVDFLHLADNQRVPFNVLLIVLAVCLAGVLCSIGIRESTANGRDRATVVFLLVWILLPLVIYAATRTFSHRSMYVPAIPACILLSFTLVRFVRSILQPDAAGRMRMMGFIAGGLFLAAVLFSLVLYSPLFRTYGEWKDSGKMSALYLEKLSGIVPILPDDAVIRACNLPTGILAYEKALPRVKSVSYLGPRGIEAWLELNYPENRMQVVLCSTRAYPTCPTQLNLIVEPGEGANVTIVLVVPPAF